MKESLKKAQANYYKKCKAVMVRVNRETETDIIEWIEQGNGATRIKELIREDIKKKA